MYRLAARREDAGRDGQRIAEHGLRFPRREKTGDKPRCRADKDAPSGRAVGPRQPLHGLEKNGGMRFPAAIGGRHAKPVETRFGETPRDILRQETVGLDFGGARGNLLGKSIRCGNRIGRAAHAYLRIAHRGLLQAPSFSRLAILFFCMFDEPPTIGRLIASRT